MVATPDPKEISALETDKPTTGEDTTATGPMKPGIDLNNNDKEEVHANTEVKTDALATERVGEVSPELKSSMTDFAKKAMNVIQTTGKTLIENGTMSEISTSGPINPTSPGIPAGTAGPIRPNTPSETPHESSGPITEKTPDIPNKPNTGLETQNDKSPTDKIIEAAGEAAGQVVDAAADGLQKAADAANEAQKGGLLSRLFGKKKKEEANPTNEEINPPSEQIPNAVVETQSPKMPEPANNPPVAEKKAA